MKFEEKIKQLEEIVEKLESGEVSLEESIELFKKGTKLSLECKKTLDEAQIEINSLTSEGNENDG